MKRELTAQRGPLWDIRCADPTAALARLRAAGVAASAYGNRLHLFAREDELHARVRPLLGADARCQLRPVSMEDVFVERVTALEAEKPA
jgi:ABC-2 type transport system ATP-binding protein